MKQLSMKWAISALILLSALRVQAQWNTNGTNISNSNSGNVGIGITTPGTWFGGKTLEIADGRPVLKFNAQGATALGTIVFTNSLVNATSHNGEFHITHQFNQTENNKSLLNFGSYPGGTSFVLQADGNVGIGTTSPSSKLHIAGPSSNYIKIDKTGDSFESGLVFTRTDGVLFYLYNDDINNALKIQAAGLSGEADATPRMQFPLTNKNIYMVQSGGNVGIGTAAPDEKLTIKGKIHAEEFKIDLSVPGPDYVFEKDYNLPTLDETEKYIQQNKHLPEVPSAKEMATNGVMVGEMNMLLLKKVEELTLYLIEQNKMIEALSVQSSAQQKEIEKLKSVNSRKQK